MNVLAYGFSSFHTCLQNRLFLLFHMHLIFGRLALFICFISFDICKEVFFQLVIHNFIYYHIDCLISLGSFFLIVVMKLVKLKSLMYLLNFTVKCSRKSCYSSLNFWYDCLHLRLIILSCF